MPGCSGRITGSGEWANGSSDGIRFAAARGRICSGSASRESNGLPSPRSHEAAAGAARIRKRMDHCEQCRDRDGKASTPALGHARPNR